MDITIFISGMSLLISFITLYFNYIKYPKVRICLGDSCKIYYADYVDGGRHGGGIYLPVDFVNSTNKTAVIIKTAIVLYNKQNSNNRYFMKQSQFSKLDINKNLWVYDELAHSIVIPPNNSVNKIIWYYWFLTSSPDFKYEKGDYELKFYYWSKPNKKPRCVKSSFSIDDSILCRLEQAKNEQSTSTLDVILEKDIDRNRFLTINEETKLLG